MASRPDVAVVHLVRAANGVEPFARFLASYRAFPAGEDHDLILIFKGFEGGRPPEPFQALVSGLPHRSLAVPDRGFDIAAYRASARAFEYRTFGFLNSFSVLLGAGWLAKLVAVARDEAVGVAGATGSWESASSWADGAGRPARDDRASWPRRAVRAFLHRRSVRRRASAFPPFPNPHVRTNAFAIRRERWLGLRVGRLKTKDDALRFESGRDGMTRQLLGLGLEPMIVGRDGRAYPHHEWPESRTFRAEGQENLLVADNRTREYDEADASMRDRLSRHAWGVGAGATASLGETDR